MLGGVLSRCFAAYRALPKSATMSDGRVTGEEVKSRITIAGSPAWNMSHRNMRISARSKTHHRIRSFPNRPKMPAQRAMTNTGILDPYMRPRSMRVGRIWPFGWILTLCPRNAVIPLGKRDCLADMNLLSRDQFLLIATRGDG